MDIEVTVSYAPAARQVEHVALTLPANATVVQALQRSGLLERFPELALRTVQVGVWGRKAELEQVLRNQDRVELYRPLRVDPKVARRERFARQGARTTGLFAKRRAGSKPGY